VNRIEQNMDIELTPGSPSPPPETHTPESPPAPPIYNWDLAFERLKLGKTMVSAEQAQAWLSGNIRNRGISLKHIQKLLGIYLRGNWKLNGDPIVFDWNGVLINGQHRLSMIVKTGQAVPCVIIEGVDPESFPTYDLGKRRTVKDVVLAGGTLDADESPMVVAAAIGYLAAYLKNKTFRAAITSEDERLDIFDEHPELRDYAKLYKGKNGLRISGGLFATIHYLFAGKDKALADEFMLAVLEAEILAKEDPAYRFREWVERKMGIKRTVKNLNQAGQILIKAWNHFRAGEKLDSSLRPPSIPPEIE